MNTEWLRENCLSRKGVTESFPFDENTLVFKVMGKMFAAYSLERSPLTINLKCDPDRALELREAHPEIQPGYHMSKKHWNTITIDGGLNADFINEQIDHSYTLVCKGLTRKQKEELASL